MYYIYYILIAALVTTDQLVKHFIRSNMTQGETIPVIENILHITYVGNRGAAFSILQGQTALLVVIPAILACAIIVYIYEKRSSHFTLLLALSLICGGGVGNFIDRIRMGYVVDFIDFRVFPVFNVADICVCCGCGLLLIYMFFFDKTEKENKECAL